MSENAMAAAARAALSERASAPGDAELRRAIMVEVCQAMGAHARDLTERGADALPVTVENVSKVEHVAGAATDRIIALLRSTIPSAAPSVDLVRKIDDILCRSGVQHRTRVEQLASLLGTPVDPAGGESDIRAGTGDLRAIAEEVQDAFGWRTNPNEDGDHVIPHVHAEAANVLAGMVLRGVVRKPDPLAALKRVTAVICWQCRSVTYTEDFYAPGNCTSCDQETYALPLVFRAAPQDTREASADD